MTHLTSLNLVFEDIAEIADKAVDEEVLTVMENSSAEMAPEGNDTRNEDLDEAITVSCDSESPEVKATKVLSLLSGVFDPHA